MPATQMELSPYEFDEFVVWAFGRGVAGRIADGDVARLVAAVDDSKGAFAAGVLIGAFEGALTRLHDEVRAQVDQIFWAIDWTLEGYTTVYDPDVLLRGFIALGETPGTAAFKDAVRAFGDELRIRHPAVRDAVDSLAEVVPALEALAEWMRQPDAMRQVVGALALDLGDLLGDAWAEALGLIGRPQAMGEAIGDTIGSFVVDVGLWMYGL